MVVVLKICGHKLIDFAEELDKSYEWTRTTLAGMKQIPFKYYDKLLDFVQEDNFNLAVGRIEAKRSEWKARRGIVTEE